MEIHFPCLFYRHSHAGWRERDVLLVVLYRG